MTDWLVLCVRRLDPADRARITHVGVEVPRGTQHVPVAEAIAGIAAGHHRFFVDVDGDLIQLRPCRQAAGLFTSLDAPGHPVLARWPDCGDAARFDPAVATIPGTAPAQRLRHP